MLSPDGRFVAYQFRSKVKDFGEPRSSAPRPETHSGFWNVPPMRYLCVEAERVARVNVRFASRGDSLAGALLRSPTATCPDRAS